MKGTLMFVAGAVIGSVVTWKFVERKYRELAEEEIESVRELYLNKESSRIIDEILNQNENIQVEEISRVVEKTDYSKIVKGEKYSESVEDDDCTIDIKEDDEERTLPYIIEPDEFGSIEHYGTKTLTYYADNILTDEIDNIIKDIDSLIGPDALSHIGEYEDDAIHVRDIDNELDFEILKSENKFSEIKKRGND